MRTKFPWRLRQVVWLLALSAVCLQLGACASTYDGPVTNDNSHVDSEGPPLMTNGFAP